MLSAATQALIEEIDKEIGRNRKSRLIIAKGEKVKQVIDPTTKEAIDARLRDKYPPDLVAAIWKIEEMYQEALKTRKAGELLKMFFPLIQDFAAIYERKYSGWRISRHDFESKLVEEFARLLSKPKTNEKYTFYETFTLSFKYRAKDVARKVTGARNKQTRFEREAIPLEDHHESKIFQGVIVPDRSTMEERLEAKEAVRGIFASDNLTDDERKLLSAMQEDTEASFRDLAKICGFYDHKKVKRVLDSIRDKMQEFNPYN